jgi:threonylcarbamoyladenosine tRNA methylthiotransferase MtaB
MPSFSIQNFGCRVNQAEAFAWVEAFRKGGLRMEDDSARSDLVLVNSCTLTGRADRDVRKFIKMISRENPTAKLVVTGCYAERARAEIERLPQVLLVLPNSEKNGLPEKVLALAGMTGSDERAEPGMAGPADGVPFFRSRALLKVQDGCDNRCAFCVIPSVRGKSASLGEEEVLACVRNLVRAGYREVVLAGIHLSSYGQDREPKGSLLELLRVIETVEGLGRIRLSSLDPGRTDGALVAHVAGNPRVCQHFHLSLQHASKQVLEKMGRSAGPEVYRSLLSDLRERSPEASLGADVIVGFPGETDDDFTLLEEFLSGSPLTYFHVFSYSPRQGTPAAAKPQVPERIKRERSLALRKLSAEKNLQFRASFSGKELEAVVIGRGEGRNGQADDRTEVDEMGTGIPTDLRSGNKDFTELLTGNYIRVLVPSCPAPRREIVRVRITRVLPHSTEGEVVKT